jgi:perosamine synthetase
MNYRVSLSSVSVPPEAKGIVGECLDKGAIGQREYIERFEDAIAAYVGAKHCVAVSSGTMADTIAVAVAREVTGARRVVVPALTFIAQPNAVRYNGLDVTFCDVNDYALINPERIDIDNKYLDYPAILFAADLMGRIADYDSLMSQGQFVIEDACEAFGSRRGGRSAGTFGHIGTFSFFPSHTISTGEGGAIVTDDPKLALLARSYREHGRNVLDTAVENKFTFPRFGFNGKMSGLQAALGCAVMLHVDEYVTRRRQVFAALRDGIGGFAVADGDYIIPHGYPIRFDTAHQRDMAVESLTKAGVEVRRLFSCIPQTEPYYRAMRGDCGYFPYASTLAQHCMYLPCHHCLTDEDVQYMIYCVKHLDGRVA